MATGQAVWGIEIGRAALKALRCRMDGDSIVADAFDFIEYPKLLSQPDAEVPTLIREALNQFLSRNSVRGDKVAIAVSGESGLAKYFKPPPVDRSKIADIVKYEARQQIPFALDDVIWDYQLMPGYRDTDGFVMDSEIGLFAMKREQVFKALQPYRDAGIEVDFIQLAPLAVYNYIAYDLARPLKEGEEYDPEKPPPSIVVMSMGTDTTDLVVSNGYRLWQRNIPLGGNHFTKQLSKELKLTFAKAEHLKRTPQQADDPKAIFTAMRSVFADIVTEVQRSVSFFRSLDRKADIQQLVMLGNTVKLPGLQQYVIKHLGLDSTDVASFNRLNGSSVVSAPSFKENVLSFAVCYGLCVQGLGKAKLSTNLLPRELTKERMIRAKKPWAVAAVGGVLLACAINFISHFIVYNEVHLDRRVQDTSWDDALKNSGSVSNMSTQFISKDTEKMAQLEKLQHVAEEIKGANDRKLLWLELMYAISSTLPESPELKGAVAIPTYEQLPFTKRRELHIKYVESQYYPDLKVWYNEAVKRKHNAFLRDLEAAERGEEVEVEIGDENAAVDPMADPAAAPMDPAATQPAAAESAPADGTAAEGEAAEGEGPTGPGWVIELAGYHYFKDGTYYGPAHVRATLMKALENGEVDLPIDSSKRDSEREFFTMKQMGISFPILASEQWIPNNQLLNPAYEEPRNGAELGGMLIRGSGEGLPATPQPAAKPEKVEPKYIPAPKYEFAVQFCWQEKTMAERLKAKAEEAAQAAEAEAAGAAEGNGPVPPGGPIPSAALPVQPANNPGAPS